MPSLRKTRRTIALATAGLALASGATLTTAGTAHASPGCAQANGSFAGWTLYGCLVYSGGVANAEVVANAAPGSTDVRIYADLYANCGSGWYQIGDNNLPPDYDGKHVWQSTTDYANGGAIVSGWPGCDFTTHEYLKESGVIRLSVWKGTLHN